MRRVPVSILSKPPNRAAERVLNDAIRSANDWTPRDQEAIAGEREPDLPSIHNIHLRDVLTRDDDSSSTESATPQSSTLITQTNQLPDDLPHDYEAQIVSRRNCDYHQSSVSGQSQQGIHLHLYILIPDLVDRGTWNTIWGIV